MIVIINGIDKYIIYFNIVLLMRCFSFSLSKYRFGMTNNATTDQNNIQTIIVIANGVRISSDTIDISHKNVVMVVSIIGCILAFHASCIADNLSIHFVILLLILSISTMESFTIIPVRAMNHIPNINQYDCHVIRSHMLAHNNHITMLYKIMTGCV